jgi:uncharacterized membrane protein
MAIIFAFLAFIGWGTGDLFGTIISRKIGSYSAVFWRTIIGLTIFLLAFPLILNSLNLLNLHVLVILFLLSIVGLAGVLFFYEGLRAGNAPLVGTIGASFAALSAVLSIIFFHETVSVLQLICIAIIIFGIILSSLDFKKISFKDIFSDRGVPWALGALTCWGVYFAFVKIPISIVGPYLTSFMVLIFYLPLLFLFLHYKKISLTNPEGRKMWSVNIVNGLLLSLADITYNLALTKGNVSVAAPLAGAYPILFVILASIFFKEKLNKQQTVGVIFGLLGVVGLSIISV